MNTLSIPVVAMSSISLYVGLYHLLIHVRRRQNREDLRFSFLCFAYAFYAASCVGLYNAASVGEGAQWQRAQFIALAVLAALFRENRIDAGTLQQAIRDMGIDPEKINPMQA